ncbi:MAG: helix-turn-helix domain-containing protein [Gammaproteobacteria bacterium]|nr:helix-turn-helix domain-containing protein [Gammaproteobacteria bacterium]
MGRSPSIKKTGHSDWVSSRVVYELRLVGWTLRKLSSAHGYAPDVVKKALYGPYPNCEQIIADKLSLKPWLIWPSRYDHNHQPIRRRDLSSSHVRSRVSKHSALTVSDNGNVKRSA